MSVQAKCISLLAYAQRYTFALIKRVGYFFVLKNQRTKYLCENEEQRWLYKFYL